MCENKIRTDELCIDESISFSRCCCPWLEHFCGHFVCVLLLLNCEVEIEVEIEVGVCHDCAFGRKGGRKEGRKSVSRL